MVSVSAPLTAPKVPTTRYWSRLLSDALLTPTAVALRRWALGGVITSALIILSGAAVRLESIRPRLPRLAPVHRPQPRRLRRNWRPAHSPVGRVRQPTGDSRHLRDRDRRVRRGLAIPRPDGRRRHDLVWLAAAQPGAIVAQAVLGGIVVITKLNPALVSVHFLASVALVAAAVAPTFAVRSGIDLPRPLSWRPVRLVALGVVGTVALMMAAGTVVTGTGPARHKWPTWPGITCRWKASRSCTQTSAGYWPASWLHCYWGCAYLVRRARQCGSAGSRSG